MNWFEVEQPQGKRIAAWRRTFGIDGDEVFLPAAIAGDEMHIMLCTAYDGTRWAHYDGHAYVPARWMAAEFPKVRALCDELAASAKERAVAADH